MHANFHQNFDLNDYKNECQDFDLGAAQKTDNNSELNKNNTSHFSHNQFENSGSNIVVNTPNQYLNGVRNPSSNLYQSQVEGDHGLVGDQVLGAREERKEVSHETEHQDSESSISSNSNSEEITNSVDEGQDTAAQSEEHKEYLTSQLHGSAFDNKFMNCDKQENTSVS
jgi:hypothetical protein